MPQPAAAPATGQTIHLPDGRTLGYAEYGAPEGKTVLYFHGHPGSRYEARFLAEHATRAGTRLIGVDRPGMGLSSYRAGRRLLDWPADVLALTDRLRLERFAQNWPEADRKCLQAPGVQDLMAASLVEAMRQGTRGPAYV